MTILYNKASGLVKVGKTDEALSTLDRAIVMNKEYVKAYFKKGDILLSLLKYDEAIYEYNKVKEIGGPQTPGLREKLKHAQLELKKSKRKDYYKVLGIEVGADEAAIKKGYRKMAILWHPDKHTQNGEEATKEAEIRFKEIGEGYAILSDPKKKQMYDEGMDLEEINQGGRGGGGHGMDPNDVF
jgi:DnaJ family protein C protein 7